MPKTLGKLYFPSALLLRAGSCGAWGIFMPFPKCSPIRETRRGSDLITKRHCRSLLYFGSSGVLYIHSPVKSGLHKLAVQWSSDEEAKYFLFNFYTSVKIKGQQGKKIIKVLILSVGGRFQDQIWIKNQFWVNDMLAKRVQEVWKKLWVLLLPRRFDKNNIFIRPGT